MGSPVITFYTLPLTTVGVVASTTGATSPTAARLVVVTLLLAVSASVTPLAAAIVPPGVVVASAIATAIVVVTIATTVSLAIAATITLAIAAAAVAATSIASLVAPALVLVASSPSTAASASTSTASASCKAAAAAAATPSTTHTSGIGLGSCLLDVALFVANLLLRLPADQLYGVFSLECHKSELAPLVLCLVKWQLHIFHRTELLEVRLDISLWHVRLQSTNKYLFDPGTRLRRLGVDLLALHSVWCCFEHSFNSVLSIECDKTKASGFACRGVCLDVDINDNAELRKVFPKILVISVPAYATNKEFPRREIEIDILTRLPAHRGRHITEEKASTYVTFTLHFAERTQAIHNTFFLQSADFYSNK